MKVLWIYAHPEARSLNGGLRDEGLAALRGAGHEVRESDLYAMRWQPVVSADDFGEGAVQGCDLLRVGDASERAYHAGELSEDIHAEQEKIRWADALVVQFPLWWYGMPAILKGWFDRVFVRGFAFGLHDEQGRQIRYGDGKLAGKRALVVTTVGGREASYGPRGANGPINDLLHPLLHGTMWYTGLSVLPPLVVYGADRVGDCDFGEAAGDLRARLAGLPTDEPLPFRYQNRGDYDDDMVLRPTIQPRHRSRHALPRLTVAVRRWARARRGAGPSRRRATGRTSGRSRSGRRRRPAAG